MKLLVYVLSALLLLSSVSAGANSSKKQQIDVSELANDSNLSDALKYGINWIFQQAANKYNTSRLNIEVNKVSSIYKWKQNKDTYYSFDVEATNNDDARINSTYTVKCDSGSGDKKVTKWKYHIDYDTPTDGDDEDCEVPDAGENVEIDIEVDVEAPEENCEESTDGGNVELEVEVDVEVDVPADKCEDVDASELDTDSNLKNALVAGIKWIFQQAADKYNVSNSNIEVTEVNSICKWKEDGNTYYTFDVCATNNDNANITSTFTVECDSDSGEKKVVGKWKYRIEYNTNTDNSDDNTDTEDCEGTSDGQDIEVDLEVDVEIEIIVDEEEEVDNNKCKDIDASQLDKDDHLKAALDHGVNWIFKKAHDKYKISDSGIQVTKVNSICSWQENGNTYYTFDVEAQNDNCDTVKLNVSVKCESDGDLKIVNEWEYKIEYADKEDEDSEDDKYVDLDISECETDEEIRDIIDEAIEYVTCKETEKIPEGDYYLKKIVSAAKKSTSSADYYKLEVKVANQDGSVQVALKFVSKVKEDVYDVESYWFQVSTKN